MPLKKCPVCWSAVFLGNVHRECEEKLRAAGNSVCLSVYHEGRRTLPIAHFRTRKGKVMRVCRDCEHAYARPADERPSKNLLHYSKRPGSRRARSSEPPTADVGPPPMTAAQTHAALLGAAARFDELHARGIAVRALIEPREGIGLRTSRTG